MPLNHSKYSNLTDDQFKLIGKLVIEFSNIDFLLGLLLSRVTLTPFLLSRNFTEKLNAHNVIKSINDALLMHENRFHNNLISNSLGIEIKNLLNKVSAIKTKRNKYAHQLWSRSDDNSIIGTKYSSKQLTWRDTTKNTGTTIKTFDELHSDYLMSYELVETLQDIIEKIPEKKI